MLRSGQIALYLVCLLFYAALMQPVGERSRDPDEQTSTTVRMTVQEAAEVLGVTVEAVRGRMHRGKYEKEKDDEGRVYVLLLPDQLPNGQEEVNERSSKRLGTNSSERSGDQTDARSRTFGPNVYKRKDAAEAELVEELRGEVAYLKEIITTRDEELRRKDTIIMQMAQRIPELEAPRDEPQGPETAPETTEGVDDTPDRGEGTQEGVQRRSWWRRFFGFE